MRFLSDVIGRCPASVAGSCEQVTQPKGSTKEEGDFPTINDYQPLELANFLLDSSSHLVSRWLPLDARTGPHQDKCVQEVGLDASRREGGVIRLKEHDAHNVITDVSLTLELQEQSGMPEHEM